MIAQPHNISTSTPSTAGDAAIPVPRHELDADRLLRLELDYPEPGTAQLRVHGDVDATNTDRLSELVCSRLRSELQVVVLDLSQLGFLSAGGVAMLSQIATFALHQHTELRILPGESPAVRRALRVTGLEQHLPLHPR